MSSTNKTTNYQLSQFVGSDKPAWLGDYNTDMSKIDTAIKGASDDATDGKTQSNTNKNAIGTLANLTTTVKDNLVSAVNEVKTLADNAGTSAVGTARLTNGAVTTDKIEDGAVTTGKIEDGAVTKDKVNLIGYDALPTPATGTVLENIPDVTATTEITPNFSGFLVGKAVCLASQSSAFVMTDNCNIAGIPYYESAGGGQMHVALCLPVKKGKTYYFGINGNAKFEGLRVIKAEYAN